MVYTKNDCKRKLYRWEQCNNNFAHDNFTASLYIVCVRLHKIHDKARSAHPTKQTANQPYTRALINNGHCTRQRQSWRRRRQRAVKHLFDRPLRRSIVSDEWRPHSIQQALNSANKSNRPTEASVRALWRPYRFSSSSICCAPFNAWLLVMRQLKAKHRVRHIAATKRRMRRGRLNGCGSLKSQHVEFPHVPPAVGRRLMCTAHNERAHKRVYKYKYVCVVCMCMCVVRCICMFAYIRSTRVNFAS